MRVCFVAVAFMALIASPALAQGTATGRLTGTITDQDGRALAGVVLIVSGPSLARPQTATTDAQGRFEFRRLPAGRFEMTCRAPGFAQWKREGIEVAAAGEATLAVKMRRLETAGPGELPAQVPLQPAGGGDGGAPPPPPPAHELLRDIDDYLARLDQGSIAFNAPSEMHASESVQIRLLLSPTRSEEDLKRDLDGLPGAPEGAQVRVAPQMEAVLTGQDFQITAITPQRQAVSRGENTEWRWEVTPKATGSRRLHLTLNAVIAESARTLRTFDRTIEVQVSVPEQVGAFVERNWQWMLTTLVVPLAGWMWARRNNTQQVDARKPQDTGKA